jgi:hypothetical protein
VEVVREVIRRAKALGCRLGAKRREGAARIVMYDRVEEERFEASYTVDAAERTPVQTGEPQDMPDG